MQLSCKTICQVTVPSISLDNPAIKAAQPHLSIAGKTICQHFLAALHEAAATPAYHNYFCHKLNPIQVNMANPLEIIQAC